MMTVLNFIFYDISVRIRLPAETAPRLELAFPDFISSSSIDPIIVIEFAEDRSSWGRSLQLRDGLFLNLVSRHHLKIFLDSGSSLDPALISYLYLHSLLGAELEARGWTRIHAAGFQSDQKVILLYGAPGAGKSTWAKEILEHADWGLLGDEVTWIDPANQWRPFPQSIRLKTDPKKFISIPKHRQAEPSNAGFVFVHLKRSSHAKMTLNSLGLFDRLRLIFLLVLGYGLPQMKEILLDHCFLFNIPQTAWRRLRVAIRLTSPQSAKTLRVPFTDPGPRLELVQNFIARIELDQERAPVSKQNE